MLIISRELFPIEPVAPRTTTFFMIYSPKNNSVSKKKSGAENKIESMESRSPPLPGIILPESLKLAARFITDSTRSPIMEVNAAKKAIVSIEIKDCSERYGINFQPKKPNKSGPAKPPTYPAMLLLGLALKIFLLFFPRRTPKSQAIESELNTRRRNEEIRIDACSHPVIRDMNEIRYPQ